MFSSCETACDSLIKKNKGIIVVVVVVVVVIVVPTVSSRIVMH